MSVLLSGGVGVGVGVYGDAGEGMVLAGLLAADPRVHEWLGGHECTSFCTAAARGAADATHHANSETPP